MKGVVTIIVSLLGAHTIPIPSDKIETIYFENEANDTGYHFKYETSDGVLRSEQGYLEGENKTLRVTGEYEFKFPDGKMIKVMYRADENGYSQKTVPIRAITIKPIANTPLRTRIGSSAIASLVGGGLG